MVWCEWRVRVAPAYTGMGTCLSGHTVFFSVSHHTTTPHTPHRPHTTPRHKTQHHTETDRDRQRQTETETEGEEWTKEKTNRQEQREERRVKREKIHFQCGGAWPFFVGVVIFQLIPFAEQCQVKFIFDFSALWPVNSFSISAN